MRVSPLPCLLFLACADSDRTSTSVQPATPPAKPETLTLPATPVITATTVGYLPAKWDVTPQGQFVYTIPLDVPAGRAGMQPELALTYSSAGGNGLAGVGWALAGLSEIAPCPRTMIADGHIDGVDYDKSEPEATRDVNCLDGRRLVDLGNGELRTEQESYAKIVYASSVYTVYLRDGRIRTYRPKTAIRKFGKASGNVQDTEVIERWVIAEERDREGNAIVYNHQTVSDGQGGQQIIPTSIEYTQFGTEAGRRRVEFTYSERRDTEFAWRSGVRASLVKRLAAITMLAPNPDSTRPVWTYRLGYSSSSNTDRSLLGSVEKCGILPDGTVTGCLWSKRFEWYGSGPLQFTTQDVYTSIIWSAPGSQSGALVHTLDVDGNGRDDVLYQPGKATGDPDPRLVLSRDAALDTVTFASANNSAFLPSMRLGAVQPVDVDGNGTSEVFVERGSCAPKVLGYDGTRFVLQTGWEATCNTPATMFLDFDGDARLDLVEALYGGGWKLYRNTGTSFAPGETTTIESGAPSYVTDLDGDGRAELVGSEKGEPTVFRLDDAGAVEQLADADIEPSLPADCPGTNPRSLSYGDFNGDGLQDVLTYCDDGPALSLAWNTGNGIGPAIAVPLIPGLQHGSKHAKIRVADMNRDGRADLVVFHQLPANAITIMRSRGDGTFVASGSTVGAGLWINSTVALPDHFPTSKLGDFNGDGHVDIVRVDPGQNSQGTLKVALQTPHTTDRMLGVSDAATMWRRETIHYNTEWSDKTEPRPKCQYPLRCTARGLTVVRSVESRAHLADANPAVYARKLYYSYEDAVTDMRGRGFLGFGKFKIWDPERPMETIISFNNRHIPVGKSWYFANHPAEVMTVVGLEPLTKRPPEYGTETGNARVSLTAYTTELVSLNGNATYDDRSTGSVFIDWEQPITIDWGELDDAPVNPTSDHMFVIKPPDLGQWLRARSTEIDYDTSGNLTRRIETSGVQVHETTTSYDPPTSDWLIARPKKHCTRAASQTEDVTHCEQFTVTPTGRLATRTREVGPYETAGRTIAYTYDQYGLITRIARTAVAPDGAPMTREVNVEYDPMWPGQPDERVFPSQIWHTRQNLAKRPSTWAAYHPALGLPSAWMDANGVQGSIRYDALGRRRTLATEGNVDVSFGYTARLDAYGGQNGVITTRTESTFEARSITDALGREIQVTDPAFDGTPTHVATRYDTLGRVAAKSRPYTVAPTQFTTYFYDPLDRMVKTKLPDNTERTATHEPFLSRTWDPMGHESQLRYDLDGRVIESSNITNGSPITTKYSYAPFGDLQRVTDHEGNVTETSFDRWGRPYHQVDPTTGATALEYNGFDEVVEKLRTGILDKVSYTHDDLGRVVSAVAVDGTTTMTWDDQPFGIGKLAQTSSPDGVTTVHHYDASGRSVGLDQIVGGETFSSSWTWTGNNKLHDLRYPSSNGTTPGLVLRHQYNTAGHLKEIFDITAGYTSIWKIDGRNLDDALTAATFGNGFTVKRSYTPALGQLSSTQVKQGATNVYDVAYTYHPDGLVWTKNDAILGLAETYGYDELSRLTRWQRATTNTNTVTDYKYDPLGNLEHVFQNQVLVEENTYGLGTTKPYALASRTANGTTTAYGYDGTGRQTSAGTRSLAGFTIFDLPRTVDNAGAITTLAYSAFGERARKQSPAGTTVYLGKLYDRRQSAGKTIHTFRVYAAEGQVAEITQTTVRKTAYVASNHLGTVDAMIDHGTGTVSRQFVDPWGKRVVPPGSSTSRLGFTGHEHDDDLGFINMRGRLYDPEQRRMVSPDPYVAFPLFGQSWNPYSYVLDNPTNYVDLTGYTPDMYSDCTYFVDGCGNGLNDLIGSDVVGAVVSLSNSSVGYGTGQIGWSSSSPGGAGYGGVVQSTIDGYAEFGSAALDGHGVPAIHADDTHGGPAAPCGRKGNPRCGTADARARNRSELLARIDRLARTFGDRQVPRPPPGGLTILQSLMRTDVFGVEYTAGIIVGTDGAVRFTQVFAGSRDESKVKWDEVELAAGDRVIGTIHTHPGLDAHDFSKGDIDSANTFAKENKDALHPAIGVQFYLLFAAAVTNGVTTPGFAVFNQRTNTVSPVPP